MGGLILQIIFIILLLIFLLFFVVQFFNIIFRGFAPFISTRPRIIKEVIKRLEINDSSVIYELGCGKAGFLRAIRKQNKKVKLVGAEYSWLPYFISRIQNSLTKSKLVLFRKNIFLVDIYDADIIYCFLNRATMVALEKKFDVECKPGTKIISYNFPLPTWEPEEVVELKERKEKIFFYQK